MRASLVTAVYARLLAARQEPDGHCETGDERTPESCSAFTATAISNAAIQRQGHTNRQADTDARLKRARAWLLSHTPRSTEERAWRIFKGTMDRLARELKAPQQPDGGWASLDGRPSDGYSTSQSFWALGLAASSATNNARGIDYLLRTQASDGSWHVASRLLDGGFDPNSATKSGGTTALMLARRPRCSTRTRSSLPRSRVMPT